MLTREANLAACVPSFEKVSKRLLRFMRHSSMWARRRVPPLVGMLALLLFGVAYSLAWGPLVRHHSYWVTPGPVWDTYRSTEELLWGNYGGIYALHPALVTFPGILFVLAPCVWLCHHLGLHGAFPFAVAHPSAWMIVGPYSMLVASSALFALDRQMREVNAALWRRLALSGTGAVALFPVVVLWGHPEDALAVALLTWALSASLRGRSVAAGWLAGLAIAVQPLVLLVLAVVVLRYHRRQWPGLLARMALPSVALLAVPLATHFRGTWHSISAQPNYPAVDHPTPLLAFATRLAPERFEGAVRLVASGHGVKEVAFHMAAQPVVAAGPLRSVSLLCALVVAVVVWRWRRWWLDDPSAVAWLGAVGFSLRVVFEPVMDPFYVWPALAFMLLATILAGGLARIGSVAAVTVLVSVVAELRLSPWAYWAPIVALLLLGVVLSLPVQRVLPLRRDGRRERARG
jgi:hypothetical protein